jgi:outer membrane receptor protein involved in Fe transport
VSSLIRRTCACAFVVALIAGALPAFADVVGAVRGIVTSSDRHPLAHVTVTLAGERTTLQSVTGDDGRFAFPAVPFGHYTLRAATPDGNAAATVDVATGAVVDVSLLAAPQIGRTGATAHGVRGTPTSENAYGARALSALPGNTNLNRIVETVPGIVRFSYDEPVAHGFHGITYELDGAPLPQSTSANFAQLVDPRDVSAVEIFTGAYPAEFGGSRMGAVVNVATGLTAPNLGNTGSLTLGGGNLGTGEGRFVQHFDAAKARIGLAFNTDSTTRGLDTPSENAIHDAASTGNAFVRVALPLGERNTLTADLSAQHAAFQIPINTSPNDPNSPIVSVPGTDDVQLEDSRFASLSFTHTSKDGNGYVQVVPWTRYDRTRYQGDIANDLLAYSMNPDGSTTAQNGVIEDRGATWAGLRASAYRASGRHAIKIGADLSQENFRSALTVVCAPGNCLSDTFSDNTAQRGTQTGLYVQDKWTPNARLAVNAGLRYDHSTGFVGGAQLSPRLEVNQEIGHGTIAHAYYGRLYSAPSLEDTRRDAVLTQTSTQAQPVYDLKPERDTYVELGLARQFGSGFRGYINAFNRTAVDVLDTTNLLNTPLFVVFNNAIGRARGLELRLDRNTAASDAGVSLTYSRAEAGGVSGSTFLFNGPNDLTLQPEDHDQRWAGSAFITRRFGPGLRTFATLQTEYGTGFPVAFENGEGRLPAHWIVNATFGRNAARSGGIGYALAVENIFDHRYLIKVNNGFNTTQWNAPRRIALRITLPW